MLELARAGCTDLDARIVLVDLIRETGWWDDRLTYPLGLLTREENREECLAMLLWPGKSGEDHASVIFQALESAQRPSQPSSPLQTKRDE